LPSIPKLQPSHIQQMLYERMNEQAVGAPLMRGCLRRRSDPFVSGKLLDCPSLILPLTPLCSSRQSHGQKGGEGEGKTLWKEKSRKMVFSLPSFPLILRFSDAVKGGDATYSLTLYCHSLAVGNRSSRFCPLSISCPSMVG